MNAVYDWQGFLAVSYIEGIMFMRDGLNEAYGRRLYDVFHIFGEINCLNFMGVDYMNILVFT